MLYFFVTITTIVDLRQKAGFLDDQVTECHGSIHHIQKSCGTIESADDLEISIDESTLKVFWGF